jgi:hypothetical protein
MKLVALLFFFILSVNLFAFEIFVSESGGPTYTLEMEANDTIENLRAKIQEQSGHVPDVQQLIFGAQTLEDGRTLSDYNIQRNDTVNLIVISNCLLGSALENGGGLPVEFDNDTYFIKVSAHEAILYSIGLFPLFLLRLRKRILFLCLVLMVSCGQKGVGPSFIGGNDTQTGCLTVEMSYHWEIVRADESLLSKGVF